MPRPGSCWCRPRRWPCISCGSCWRSAAARARSSRARGTPTCIRWCRGSCCWSVSVPAAFLLALGRALGGQRSVPRHTLSLGASVAGVLGLPGRRFSSRRSFSRACSRPVIRWAGRDLRLWRLVVDPGGGVRRLGAGGRVRRRRLGAATRSQIVTAGAHGRQLVPTRVGRGSPLSTRCAYGRSLVARPAALVLPLAELHLFARLRVGVLATRGR